MYLIILVPLFSQPSVKPQILSVNEGLSQGMVFDILQSKDGFLWIATKDGLNRYDGYRFDVYLHNPFDAFSIGANEIRNIYEDSKGMLWLGYEGGLDIFDPEKGVFFHIPMEKTPDFKDYIKEIVESDDGSILVLCQGIIWKINLKENPLDFKNGAYPTFDVKKILLPDAESIEAKEGFLSLKRTKKNEFFSTSNGGLYRIDLGVEMGLTATKLFDLNHRYRLIGGGDDENLYAFYDNSLVGLDKFAGGSTQNIVNNLLEDEQNLFKTTLHYFKDRKLILFDGKKLYQWKLKNQALENLHELDIDFPYAVGGDCYITVVYLDKTGNVWIGTSGYGVIKFSTEKPKFQSYLPLKTQRQILEDPDGNIITKHQANIIFKNRNFDLELPNPWFTGIPKKETVVQALFDKQGNCWVRTYSGKLFYINKYDKKAEENTLPGMGLLIDRNGHVLSFTEEVLFKYNPASKQIRTYPFGVPLKYIYNLNYELSYFYEDRKGEIWITGFNGLIRAIPKSESYQFIQYKNNPDDRNTLSNNFVLSITEDPAEPENFLWVGTKGGGLNRLDRHSGKITAYGLEEGLPDLVVYGILADNTGYLWFSTNKGLCRASFKDRKPVFKNFTIADGLQSSEFNQSSYLKTKDGTFIFGGVNGITVFHPDSLRFRNSPPQTQIVSVAVANQKRRLNDFENIEIHPNQKLLVIEFAALDFCNPTQNKYRYELQRRNILGISKSDGWVELGYRNTVQLVNLPAGKYIFNVSGCDDEGTWSTESAKLSFIVLSPWWATWWAYLIYITLMMFVIFRYYRFRLGQRIIEQEALRLKELDEFKNRFFTNITHEFRTPLTVILGKTEQVELKVGKELMPDIGLIRRSGENLLRLINQILDLAKLENQSLQLNYIQGDVITYVKYLAESMHSIANSRNVILKVEIDPDSQRGNFLMDYDPERLLQIVYNLLSNAIKFTPSGGKVVLRLKKINNGTQEKLSLAVIDTGTGISSEDLPHIFDRFYQTKDIQKLKNGGTGIGLAFTRELVKAMGGKISVLSNAGEGTTFTVLLPVTKNAKRSEVIDKNNNLRNIESDLAGDNKISTVTRRTELSNGNKTDQTLILIIEDNPDVVEYLASCLTENNTGKQPYVLSYAYNGRAGIEMALENIPDIIISDVMMPEKDGLEVCETLKNDERTSHIPIILLTAKADVESRISGLKRGADAYISKPFHSAELLITLSNLLELRLKLHIKYSKQGENNSPLLSSNNGNQGLKSLTSLSSDPEDAFLHKLRSIIFKHIADSAFTVEDLSRSLALSQRQLHRKLTALTGKNAMQIIRDIRLNKAKELLMTKEKNVSEVAYETGFDDPKYFSRIFTEEFGVPPSKI